MRSVHRLAIFCAACALHASSATAQTPATTITQPAGQPVTVQATPTPSSQPPAAAPPVAAGQAIPPQIALPPSAAAAISSNANDHGLRVVTLAQALQTARTHEPELRQATAQTQAARARAAQSKAGLLPSVNASGSYQLRTANRVALPGAPTIPGASNGSSADLYGNWNFGVNANQLIYDFGQTSSRYDAAKENANATASNEDVTALQIAANVRSAYFDAVENKALIAVAQEALDNEDRHLGQIQGFVEVGTRPEIDLVQERTTRSTDKLTLIQAQNAYAVSKAQLNRAMGLETDIDFDVTNDAFANVEGEEKATGLLIDEALKARPEFAALQSQKRAQEYSLLAIEHARWAPSLNALAGATEAGRSLDALAWNFNLGLSVSWSIYQGGTTIAQADEANANLRGLEAQVDVLRQQVRVQLEQSRLSVLGAKAAIDAAEEAIVNARERLRLAEGRYETGVGNAIELGDAQLALTNVLAQKVQAEHDLAAARSGLILALGRP